MFSNLSTLPNENTLEVNVTHQQLSSLSNAFEKRTAIAPTRYEEGASSATKTPDGKGYDIKLDTVKELVFQYKAPTGTRVLGATQDIQWLKYSVNMTQVYNLVLQYNPGEAFLALPATPQQLHVREGLERTIFIDVYAIFLYTLKEHEETSWIYVEYTPSSKQFPHVIGKYNTGKWSMKGGMDEYPYYHLSDRTTNKSPHVYSWSNLKSHVEKCNFGLPVRGVRETEYFDTIDLNPDRFPEEYDQLPGGFDAMDDFLEGFDPDYRGFIKRRFALDRFSKAESKETKRRYQDLLMNSVNRRVMMGRELERLSIPEGVIFDFPEYRQGEEWSLQDMLGPFEDTDGRITKGLSENCRYILEDGDETVTRTI